MGAVWMMIAVLGQVAVPKGEGKEIEPKDIVVIAKTRVYKKQGRSDPQIWTVRGDGSGLRALTDDRDCKEDVRISFNGQSVVYAAWKDEKTPRYHLVQSNLGTGLEIARLRLPEKAKFSQLQWGMEVGGEGEWFLPVDDDWFCVDFENERCRPIKEGWKGSWPEECRITFNWGHPAHSCPSPYAAIDGTSIEIGAYPEGDYLSLPDVVLCVGSERKKIEWPGGQQGELDHLFDHRWSPDGRRIAIVPGQLGASSWGTYLYVIDVASGAMRLVSDEGENIRWVGGSRYLLSCVGNKVTKEFQETGSVKKIQVWANDLVLFDLETGRRTVLIPQTSYTSEYDVTYVKAR